MKKSYKILLTVLGLIILAIIAINLKFNYQDEKNNSDPNFFPPATSTIDTPSKNIDAAYLKNLTDSMNKIVWNTKYIHAVDWPPKVQVTDQKFSCTEAGNVADRAGKTELRMINGNQYCVTVTSDGAAGSVYNSYAYVRELYGKTIIFTFSSREVQCMNYDNPQQTECLNERKAFDVDSIVDQIDRSL